MPTLKIKINMQMYLNEETMAGTITSGKDKD